jgi:hypothetical protein
MSCNGSRRPYSDCIDSLIAQLSRGCRVYHIVVEGIADKLFDFGIVVWSADLALVRVRLRCDETLTFRILTSSSLLAPDNACHTGRMESMNVLNINTLLIDCSI